MTSSVITSSAWIIKGRGDEIPHDGKYIIADLERGDIGSVYVRLATIRKAIRAIEKAADLMRAEMDVREKV